MSPRRTDAEIIPLHRGQRRAAPGAPRPARHRSPSRPPTSSQRAKRTTPMARRDAAVERPRRGGSRRHASSRGTGGRPPAARPLTRRIRRAPRPPRFRFRAGQSQRRVKLIFALSLALLVAVIGRVVLLQTTQASALQKAGKQQRTSERILKAQRGTIFAADGAELALSVPSSTIIANPKLVTDPAGTAATLAALLKLSPAKQTSLQEAFTQKQTSFVYVVRQIDPSLAATVDGLRLAGVDVLAEEHRTMPSGAVGKSVLGRTDIDGIGIAGLERQFDQMLTGIDGERVTEHDRQGRSIAGSGTTTKAPVAGEDLVLTIDRSLQYQVEQALLARVDEPSVMAKGGTVVVMDTKSGNIRAIANVRRNDQGVAEITSANLAAVEARDPGSVAKVFSIAAAIDSGMVTPDTYFEVPGTYTFDRGTSYERTIRDAEPHNTESYSVRQIMTKSSNIGTMMVAGRMTPEQLHDYQAAFGFGSKTALDFPDETPGILRAADTLRGSEVATVSYGYGFSVSSLQLIAGVNTIANRGTYVAPRLVEATIDRGGERVGAAPSITRQVVKPETAAEMTSIMTDVVCRGTAKQARMDGVVSVAGKTGTAYKLQDNKTYQTDGGARAYFASFVGFLPAQDPQITILVSIDEPDPLSNDRFGGTAAAPLFVNIAKDAMHELQIERVEGDTGCPST